MKEKTSPDILPENSESTNRKLVYGAAVLFSLIVGFSFLAIKNSMVVATPLEILTHRYNFAAIAAFIPLALGHRDVNFENKSREKLFLTTGFYLGFMSFQALGLVFATSIESGIIFAVVPIFAKIIAYFYLGEKGTLVQNAFVILSISAVIAMFVFGAQDFQGVSMIGLILLIISSVLMAFSNVFMRGVRGEYNPATIAFSIAVGGCLLFNMISLASGVVTEGPLQYFAPLRHWEFVVATAFLGALSTTFSSRLIAYMLAHMEAVKATIFGNLSTAISIIAGVIFLKEPLHLYHIVCTTLIIIGVIGTSLSGAPRPDRERKTNY